jgi:hypothetical protein
VIQIFSRTVGGVPQEDLQPLSTFLDGPVATAKDHFKGLMKDLDDELKVQLKGTGVDYLIQNSGISTSAVAVIESRHNFLVAETRAFENSLQKMPDSLYRESANIKGGYTARKRKYPKSNNNQRQFNTWERKKVKITSNVKLSQRLDIVVPQLESSSKAMRAAKKVARRRLRVDARAIIPNLERAISAIPMEDLKPTKSLKLAITQFLNFLQPEKISTHRI